MCAQEGVEACKHACKNDAQGCVRTCTHMAHMHAHGARQHNRHWHGGSTGTGTRTAPRVFTPAGPPARRPARTLAPLPHSRTRTGDGRWHGWVHDVLLVLVDLSFEHFLLTHRRESLGHNYYRHLGIADGTPIPAQ